MSENKFVAAIDQGTTSTRCIIFNHDGEQVSVGQFEHEQIFPKRVGLNTTRRKSGTTPAVLSARLWPTATSPSSQSLRWASPTSARPPLCGIKHW